MGALIKLVDAVLFIFFLETAIHTPILSTQVVLPPEFFPKPLVDLYQWYSNEIGDYLFVEKPTFFVGLAWIHIVLVWPLILVNMYGIVRGKSWFNNTCLIYGVSAFTARVAILAELIISTRITGKQRLIYFPFTAVAVLAIIRGLLLHPRKTTLATATPVLGRKRRS